MDVTEVIGIVAGICTSSALIPQVVTTFKKKKASDVSVFMFVVMLTGNALWLYYGIEKKDIPIIGTNAFSMALNIVMLFLKWKYRNNKEE
jgi:MtN3 and saliva related transmembrane protein